MTDRDNQLITEWFIPYKYATLGMLERVFFRNQDYGYTICRKRLLKLMQEDYIKAFKDETSNKNIYVYNEEKIKTPANHRLILLSFLAECIYLGFHIERFQIEKPWCDGKYRSDALIQFTVDPLGDEAGKRKRFFIEVQTSNNYHRLDKYDDLFKTGEVQKELGIDYFPKVLLIADRKYSNINLKYTKVLQINTHLNSLASILL